MKSTIIPVLATFLMIVGVICPSGARGELADIGENPWMGCFAGYEGSKVWVKVHSSGGLLILPVYEKGEPRPYINIPVTYGVQRTMPNGVQRDLSVIPESLDSDDEETTKFKETVIRGECEGGVKFEVTIEQKRGVVSVGGRVTDPGEHDPKTVRFHVSARVLNFYGSKKVELANNPEAFKALVSKDSLKYERTDGKRQELDFIKPMEMGSEEVNGPGVSEAEVDIGSIKRRFLFEATGDSAMRFSNRREAPLNEGMFVNWSPDPEKDHRSEARLVIAVKGG